MATLPLVNFAQDGQLNGMEELFAWLPSVENCDAYMHYRPGSRSASLLFGIKYHGYEGMAVKLGELMARKAEAAGILKGVEAIVPVPLHWSRKMRRGFNQSERLACGIARHAGLPVINALRCRYHPTQTHLGEAARRENVQGIYSVRKGVNLPRRIMLVDDVCTTGATLGAAAFVIEQAFPTIRQRIMAFALTDR